MLYQIAHYIQKRIPFLWRWIEGINSFGFGLLYGKRLAHLPENFETDEPSYTIRRAAVQDVDAMVTFFANQPEQSYTYFRPHAFDAKTLRTLIMRKSMIMYLVWNTKHEVIGYFFLRCFCMGKGYRGYIVDYRYYRKGIGLQMGKALNQIAMTLQIPTYKTISPNNISSMELAKKVCTISTLGKTNNGDLHIQCLL